MSNTESETGDAQNVAGDIGIVYVLTNPAMPDYVKIGFTNNLQQRMESLDNTSVPVPFVCIFAARVNKPKDWEQTLHMVFEESRINRRREFFTADVIPRAVRILQTAQVSEVSQSPSITIQPEEKDASDRIVQLENRQPNFDFEILEIPVGAILEFAQDENITCEVFSQKPPKVKFGGEVVFTSFAAARAMGKESSAGVRGPLYWVYEGETLVARQKRLAEESSDDR